MNHAIKFPDRGNKTTFVPTSFSYFLELLWEKINLSLKSVIVITVIISEIQILYCLSINRNVLRNSWVRLLKLHFCREKIK